MQNGEWDKYRAKSKTTQVAGLLTTWVAFKLNHDVDKGSRMVSEPDRITYFLLRR